MKLIGNGKYELGGPKEDSIGLPVFPKDLSAVIEVEGYTLIPKTTFHVTLVAVGEIIKKHNVSIPDFLKKVTADFLEFTRDNEVGLIRYRDEFRFVTQNEKKAVVVMCDILNLEKFFDRMNKKYSLTVEYPPTHITLYTLQLNEGIFLTDSKDIQLFTKVIEIPNFHMR